MLALRSPYCPHRACTFSVVPRPTLYCTPSRFVFLSAILHFAHCIEFFSYPSRLYGVIFPFLSLSCFAFPSTQLSLLPSPHLLRIQYVGLCQSGIVGNVAVGVARVWGEAPPRGSGAGLCRAKNGGLRALGREAGPCLIEGSNSAPSTSWTSGVVPPMPSSGRKGGRGVNLFPHTP